MPRILNTNYFTMMNNLFQFREFLIATSSGYESLFASTHISGNLV